MDWVTVWESLFRGQAGGAARLENPVKSGYEQPTVLRKTVQFNCSVYAMQLVYIDSHKKAEHFTMNRNRAQGPAEGGKKFKKKSGSGAEGV